MLFLLLQYNCVSLGRFAYSLSAILKARPEQLRGQTAGMSAERATALFDYFNRVVDTNALKPLDTVL